MPCPWWCQPHDEVEGDDPHARCVSIVSAGDGSTETADVAVLLWQPVGAMGVDVQGRTVWIPERVAVDVSDGEDDVPALLLSPARARSLAAGLIRAADLSEGGRPIA
jgi:hypothetical protein